MDPHPAKSCVICTEPTTMECSSCRLVAYCSVEHQKMDWKDHKKVCVCFTVKEDPGSMLKWCCVATKDLKANRTVLEENAILQVPEDVHFSIFRPLCLTCGVSMRDAGPYVAQYRCPKCRWPICSYACSTNPIHAENECMYFVERGLSFGPHLPSDFSNAILSIRADHLRDRRPDLWKKLWRLMKYHVPDEEDQEDLSYEEPGRDSSYRVRVEMLPGSWSFSRVENKENSNPSSTNAPSAGANSKSKEKTGQENQKPNSSRKFKSRLEQLLNLVSCQGYKLQCGQMNERTPGRCGTYLYSTASSFSHECSPNCHWSIGGGPDFKIRIRTSIPVTKGEKLTVSRIIYWEDAIKGTRVRQSIVRSLMRLTCRCRLCSDPTEFGTYMSGVTCQVCFQECRRQGIKDHSLYGYLVPQNPLISGQQSVKPSSSCEWKCARCGHTTLLSNEEHDRWEELGGQLSGLNSGLSISSGKSRAFCEDLIKKFSGRELHPNHWLFQCVYRILCLCYLERMQREFNDRLIQDCTAAIAVGHYLMPIYDKILPGFNPFRAYLMRTTTNANYALFYPGILKIDKLNEDAAQLHYDRFQGCLLRQTEAYEFYKNEPLFPHEETPRISDGLYVGCQKIKKHLVNLEARLATLKLQKMNLPTAQADAAGVVILKRKAKKARKPKSDSEKTSAEGKLNNHTCEETEK